MKTELVLNATEQIDLKRLLKRLESELLLQANDEGWEDCRETIADDLVTSYSFLHKIDPDNYKAQTKEELDKKYGE